MTQFRQIIPNSTVNAINERYEHLLMWLSKDGGLRQWFFSHTEGEEVEDVDSFTLESLTDIRNIPIEDRIIVDCATRFMDSNTFDYVRSIFASNRVYKVLTDGTRIPISIKPRKTKRPNQIKNFELALQFELKEEDRLNV